MDINKTSYNKIAYEWAASRDQSFLSKLVATFSSRIKPGGKVLDIGCGTGYPIATYLSSCGFTITGIDSSENLLQKAIDRNIPNATFHLVDFFDFEPTEKYDGIIAFDSFFHFPKEKQSEIYQKVSTWMNEGAFLLFTHGAEEGEKEGDMFGETFYYSSLNKHDVRKLLLEAGFKIEWSLDNYTERDLDRDLVILARKVN
jgi:cyclopropane fatty-acyl-phospholipid synthase-like methyltransferase